MQIPPVDIMGCLLSYFYLRQQTLSAKNARLHAFPEVTAPKPSWIHYKGGGWGGGVTQKQTGGAVGGGGRGHTQKTNRAKASAIRKTRRRSLASCKIHLRRLLEPTFEATNDKSDRRGAEARQGSQPAAPPGRSSQQIISSGRFYCLKA